MDTLLALGTVAGVIVGAAWLCAKVEAWASALVVAGRR